MATPDRKTALRIVLLGNPTDFKKPLGQFILGIGRKSGKHTRHAAVSLQSNLVSIIVQDPIGADEDFRSELRARSKLTVVSPFNGCDYLHTSRRHLQWSRQSLCIHRNDATRNAIEFFHRSEYGCCTYIRISSESFRLSGKY